MSTQTPTEAPVAVAAAVAVVVVGRVVVGLAEEVVVGGVDVVVSVAEAARGAGFAAVELHPAETSATATTAGSV
ncbi:hypothetical protein [Nocardia lasii]|uniref:Uncharacterized protein n=1 Tax=Nocardia lasii TaxID=1616107 RepID=A0ABW1JV83_9NOCA